MHLSFRRSRGNCDKWRFFWSRGQHPSPSQKYRVCRILIFLKTKTSPLLPTPFLPICMNFQKEWKYCNFQMCLFHPWRRKAVYAGWNWSANASPFRLHHATHLHTAIRYRRFVCHYGNFIDLLNSVFQNYKSETRFFLSNMFLMEIWNSGLVLRSDPRLQHQDGAVRWEFRNQRGLFLVEAEKLGAHESFRASCGPRRFHCSCCTGWKSSDLVGCSLERLQIGISLFRLASGK